MAVWLCFDFTQKEYFLYRQLHRSTIAYVSKNYIFNFLLHIMMIFSDILKQMMKSVDGPASLSSVQCHLNRDSQVWDPGARILIYSDNNINNNNNISTKDISPEMQNKFINTRASPNKSQDSGFSDSGESESSGDQNKGKKRWNAIQNTEEDFYDLLIFKFILFWFWMMIVNCSFNTMTWSNNSSSFVNDPHEIRTNFSSIYWRILWRLGANYSCFVQGHVTKVYFYSNNAESHYQSPSSLPVYSSVTKIATGSGSLSTGNRTHHAHTLSAPDVVKLSQHRASNNKSKFHLHLIALSYIQSLKMYRKI